MKKGILLAVCLMLAGMLSVGGTYATDTTQSPLDGIFHWLESTFGDFGKPQQSDGTVQVQNVYQIRNEQGKLVEGQAEYLVPAAINHNTAQNEKYISFTDGDITYQLWSDAYAPYAADKFISVKNIKGTDVFFRTAIAIQYDEDVWPKLEMNRNTTHFDWSNNNGNTISINGKPYVLLVATYKNTLTANQTSPAMMMQLALDDVNITSDQLANTLDMRVTTVAIEASGFTEEENGPMSATKALDLAVPLNNFNPFQ